MPKTGQSRQKLNLTKMKRAVVRQYTNEMKKHFGYYAIWNPGVPLSIGDVGTFKNKEFTRLSNLKDLGIEFDIRPDKTKTNMEYNSRGSVSMKTKLAGSAPLPGSSISELDAGIFVEFSKENSTLFKAKNTTSPSIKDIIKLSEQISRRYLEGTWDKRWVIITELIEAETSTIIISSKRNGKIDLKANAKLKATAFDIADAEFQFSPEAAYGLETKFITEKGLTPLFKAMAIKTRITLPPILDVKTASDSSSDSLDVDFSNLKAEVRLEYISDEDLE